MNGAPAPRPRSAVTTALLLVPLVLALSLRAQSAEEPPPPPATAHGASTGEGEGEGEGPESVAVERYPALHLTLDFAGLPALRRAPFGGKQLRGRWIGQLDEAALEITLWRLEGFRRDARQVAEEVCANVPDVAVRDAALLHGGYGAQDGAALMLAHDERSGGSWFVLCSLLPDAPYMVQAHLSADVDAAGLAQVRQFLQHGIAYDGPRDDPRWTEAEARQRWNESVPPRLRNELKRVIRTEHYVVLCSASAGPAFAEAMEECYAAIREVFPFPEHSGQRLLPVFLFKDRSQYAAFCDLAMPLDKDFGQATKGHARGDYYATWYEAPADPVHVHEATHQLFHNRLWLTGGGSWFQEGVAEYMATSENARRLYAHAAAKHETQVPFAKFVTAPELIRGTGADSSRGGNDATNSYLQAASMIEFLRESPFGKAGFQQFVRGVGSLRTPTAQAIDAVVREVYGVGLEGVERAWIEYWRR